MAGYVFLIGKKRIGIISKCIDDGVYSTEMPAPKKNWTPPGEATFADYISMKEGDNIYFFQDRKIYGVGSLIKVGPDCKYKNYPQASAPRPYAYTTVRADMLYDHGAGSEALRWFCTFEPAPAFFKDGIDMDDVLSSAPERFRMLRAMQQVSFIKLDDEENCALRDHIIFRNRAKITDIAAHYPHHAAAHAHIMPKVTANHLLTSSDIMENCVEPDGTLRHEMALECGIIDALAHHRPECDIIGDWDYISHQVIASPFKPLAYVDKIDVFGYRYIHGLPPGYHTLSDFLIVELKKGKAELDAVEQVMKYVEWVKQEYAFGDYSRIKAYIVAGDFASDAIDAVEKIAVRFYTYGSHPATTDKWNDVTLLKYRYDDATRKLQLEVI